MARAYENTGGGTYVQPNDTIRRARKRVPTPYVEPRDTIRRAPRIGPPPVQPRPSTPVGGYTGAPASGRSLGSTSTGRIAPTAPTPPKPPIPSEKQWVAKDATYLGQTAAAKRAMDDYLAQKDAQTKKYNTEFVLNRTGLTEGQAKATQDLADDYASRGMSNSGLFLKANTDLGTDWLKRFNALETGKTDFTDNLTSAYNNFKETQRLNSQRYYDEAIRRRAQRYGLTA